MTATYSGKCFCGAVEIQATGAPEAMGYCHCTSCRSWSVGPVNAFTLWRTSNVRIIAGRESPNSQRQYCIKCGGHLMNRHPDWDLIDVFAAKLASLKFEPALHVNYLETVLPMKDGLPKLKDFPKDFGGSGDTMAE